MIKITLTETYGGFEIAGNYNDLEKLGESKSITKYLPK